MHVSGVHLQERFEHFWVGRLHIELVALQHDLGFAVVACGRLDELFDVIRQADLRGFMSLEISTESHFPQPLQEGKRGIEVWCSFLPICMPYLGEAVENRDDGFCLQAHGDGGIERVWRQHVLMHRLRPADGLCDGDEEVVRLLVDAGEGLQENPAIGTNPQRPAEAQQDISEYL